MNWNPFKRKPVTEPWDGNHNLKYVLFEEFFGDRPEDYKSGWIWKCSCGTGSGLPFNYKYTEPQALMEFLEHSRLYDQTKEKAS